MRLGRPPFVIAWLYGLTSGLAQPVAATRSYSRTQDLASPLWITRVVGKVAISKENPAMNSDDARVRKALAAEGGDGEVPRHTLFYFYGGDLSGIEKIARSHGFSSRRMIEHSGVIVEKTLAVDESHFEPVGEMMAEWAVKFRSDYDGWECELVVRH